MKSLAEHLRDKFPPDGTGAIQVGQAGGYGLYAIFHKGRPRGTYYHIPGTGYSWFLPNDGEDIASGR